MLARAHAVSGDPAAVAGYLGGKRRPDRSVAAVDCAVQNAEDHRAFTRGHRRGLEVETQT